MQLFSLILWIWWSLYCPIWDVTDNLPGVWWISAIRGWKIMSPSGGYPPDPPDEIWFVANERRTQLTQSMRWTLCPKECMLSLRLETALYALIGHKLDEIWRGGYPLEGFMIFQPWMRQISTRHPCLVLGLRLLLASFCIHYCWAKVCRVPIRDVTDIRWISGGYPPSWPRVLEAGAGKLWIPPADLIRFLANERRNIKSGPITVMFMRAENFSTYILYVYGKIIEL